MIWNLAYIFKNLTYYKTGLFPGYFTYPTESKYFKSVTVLNSEMDGMSNMSTALIYKNIFILEK